MNRNYRIVFWVLLTFLAANAILLFSVRLLPFVDLPNHLAEATIYKFREHAGNNLAAYYRAVPWYFPNTFYPEFCSLFPDVEIGNKCYYLLAFSLLQVTVYLIIRELGGNPWYGLLAVLMTYNYNVSYGFSGFSLSIPALFFFFYILLREVRNGGRAWQFGAFLLLVLIFLIHAQMGFFCLLLFVCMMYWRHRDSARALLFSLLRILPLLLLMLLWWGRRVPGPKEGSTLAFLYHYFLSSYLQGIYLRFRLPFFDNFQLHAGRTGLLIATLFFISILIPLLIYRAWKRPQGDSEARRNLSYPCLLFMLCLACYLLLPDYLPGEQIIYQRFSPVLLTSLIILGSVLLQKIKMPWLPVYSFIIMILYLGSWSEYIISFNRETHEFTPDLFRGLDNQRRMGGLIYNYQYRGRPVYIHYADYFIVWEKGIAATKLIDYRFGVIRRGRLGGLIPYYEEWVGKSYSREPAYDTSLHYLLVRGAAPMQPDSNLMHFAPLKRSGIWQIYQNNLAARLNP